MAVDKFKYAGYWDAYGPLLTDTQRDIADLYFNMDLTVSEIAEQKGVSRQSVSECLSLCKKEFDKYEEKLGYSGLLLNKNAATLNALYCIDKWKKNFLAAHPEFGKEFEELDDILGTARNAWGRYGGDKKDNK